MNKTDFKRVIDKLEPDKEMEYRLSQKVTRKQHHKFVLKPAFLVTASLVIFIFVGIKGYNFAGHKANTPQPIVANKAKTTAPIVNPKEGIYVSQITLPKNTNENASMDMIGLIMYKGKMYTQTGTKISGKDAGKLRGEKLGTTKGNIDEWSKQSDYSVEFASTTGKANVYAVKGYDKEFRIMTYDKNGAEVYSEVYECLNGITVKSGADIFNKLKIEGNIKTAKYENYESYYNSKHQYKQLTKLPDLNNLVNQLKNTIPHSQESLSYLFDEGRELDRKIVYITLNDGCEVQLMLFKEGYIYYDYAHIFFRMESGVFNELFNELK